MKICLIEPPKFVSPTNAVSTIAMPPLGIAYLASTLRSAGHQVDILDTVCAALDREYYPFRNVYVKGLKINEIVERIPKNSDLIGIGCMFTAHWLLVRELIREIKKKFPYKPIALGGEHATGFPEFSFDQSPIDFAILGEGEETVTELCRLLENKISFEQCAGLAFRKNGTIQVNPRRARLTDIDQIPLPAWDLVDVDRYMEFNQPHGAAQGRFMPMLATRGCPYECTFCTSPQMWTRKWLPRNYKLVVDEMELYKNRYGATDFQFEDLTAIVRKDWIVNFCDEIAERELEITFQLPSGTRSEAVDFEVAQKMKKAGCHAFNFAPESGDARILKAIKKQVKLPRMFESAKDAMKAGINVGCFFIIGFPEDTIGSVLRTYWAIIKCALMGFDHVNLNAYSPQPNTESFRALTAAGKIPEFNDDYLMSLFTFQDYGALKKSYNPRFSDGQLTFLVLFGTGLFYIFYFIRKPYRLFELIRDMFSKNAQNRTTQAARTLLSDSLKIFKGNFRRFKALLRPKHTDSVAKANPD
jgi:anaerobic magnesium-protoporphyrin IX monomethyl ester cyclase